MVLTFESITYYTELDWLVFMINPPHWCNSNYKPFMVLITNLSEHTPPVPGTSCEYLWMIHSNIDLQWSCSLCPLGRCLNRLNSLCSSWAPHASMHLESQNEFHLIRYIVNETQSSYRSTTLVILNILPNGCISKGFRSRIKSYRSGRWKQTVNYNAHRRTISCFEPPRLLRHKSRHPARCYSSLRNSLQ